MINYKQINDYVVYYYGTKLNSARFSGDYVIMEFVLYEIFYTRAMTISMLEDSIYKMIKTKRLNNLNILINSI